MHQHYINRNQVGQKYIFNIILDVYDTILSKCELEQHAPNLSVECAGCECEHMIYILKNGEELECKVLTYGVELELLSSVNIYIYISIITVRVL